MLPGACGTQRLFIVSIAVRPSNMLRFHELQQNPASVTFCDETGARITVVAERLRRGLVKLTCQCQQQSVAGWCKHCLAVLRDRELFEDEQCRLRSKASWQALS